MKGAPMMGGNLQHHLHASMHYTDKNGVLGAPELQQALSLGGLNFSLATVAHIIRIHDKANRGAISFEEFSKLHEFLTNVQASFDYFDRDHSNSLTVNEIGDALNHAGYQLDQTALQAVFSRFDPTRSGALGLTEFLALTLFLRSSTATFNAFDSDRSGTVSLSFDQFLFACAHCI
ncbi:Peflin [Monoraphidium neglectum]|uniref:Peflin n=1 Tax=Monoraphidium neglectum TaxID=145388 RepID=A0A0D2K351_9CHLO|nr:Peflin [Monoraphidium neglectum]KIZ04938.1 Peflin [Monoraphidium neglectum]|eukprot:XP_013903957.1 Peflin [Monoraphidium neglectum]